MEDLREWLKPYTTLPDDAWQDLANVLCEQRLPKGTEFQRAGALAERIAFLKHGALYARYAKERARHSVAFFNLPEVNRVVCDLSAFVDRKPASMDIKAVTDCGLLVLTRDQLYGLYDKHPSIERLGRRMAEYSYTNAMLRLVRMDMGRAERIADLQERHPEVFGTFQDQLIADYLGMNKSQFSKLKAARLKAA